MTTGLSVLLSHEGVVSTQRRKPEEIAFAPDMFLALVAGCAERTTLVQPASSMQAPEGAAIEAVGSETVPPVTSDRQSMMTEEPVTASPGNLAIEQVSAASRKLKTTEAAATSDELPRVVGEGWADGPERAEPAQRAGTPSPAGARPAGFTQTRTPVQISATSLPAKPLSADPRPTDLLNPTAETDGEARPSGIASPDQAPETARGMRVPASETQARAMQPSAVDQAAHTTATQNSVLSAFPEHVSADAPTARRVVSAMAAPTAEMHWRSEASEVTAAQPPVARQAQAAATHNAGRQPRPPAAMVIGEVPEDPRTAAGRSPNVRQTTLTGGPQLATPAEPAWATRPPREPAALRSEGEAPISNADAGSPAASERAAAPEHARAIVARTASQVSEVRSSGSVAAHEQSPEVATARVADNATGQAAPPDRAQRTVRAAAPPSDGEPRTLDVTRAPSADPGAAGSEPAGTAPAADAPSRGGDAPSRPEALRADGRQRLSRDDTARASADQADRSPSAGVARESGLSPTGAEFTGVERHGHAPASVIGGPEASVSIPETARAPLAELAPNRPQRLTLEVDPPELGRCELELSLREGRIHATVIAERPETVIALRAVEGQVREQLATRDLHVAEFDVRAGTQAATGQSAEQGGGGGDSRGARSSMPLSSPATAHEFSHVHELSPHRRIGGGTIDLVA